MTSLEWINGRMEIFNRRIKFLNNKLNHKHTGITDPLELDLTIEAIQTALSYATQTLQTLNQIKTELEAWEICKKHSHINNYNSNNKCFDITIWLNTENCDFESCASYDECLKVKKALEVKDD